MLLDPHDVAGLESFFSSWAWNFADRLMVFFMVGCVKRRSTRTTTVLFCLSLTTTPCNVRFGISIPLLRLCSGPRPIWPTWRISVWFLSCAAFGFARPWSSARPWARAPARPTGSAPARFCCAIVLTRAMSRRTTRTREVFSSWPVARWKRRLNCSFLSFNSSSSSWSTVMALASDVFMAAPIRRCVR